MARPAFGRNEYRRLRAAIRARYPRLYAQAWVGELISQLARERMDEAGLFRALDAAMAEV